jgi:hypothetical protein
VICAYDYSGMVDPSKLFWVQLPYAPPGQGAEAVCGPLMLGFVRSSCDGCGYAWTVCDRATGRRLDIGRRATTPGLAKAAAIRAAERFLAPQGAFL